MYVWIDEPACVGNGVCEEVCPDMFTMVDGDVARVRDGLRVLPRGGPAHRAAVPPELADAVLDAADQCPVACIHVE